MRTLRTLCVVAGLVFAAAAPAAAAPPSTDPGTGARAGAAWIARQLTAEGALPGFDGTTPNVDFTAQGVLALAAAGVGGAQVDAMLGWLAAHVTKDTTPAALGHVIQAVEATGGDARAFGTPPTDLVALLEAQEQPSGLFGTASPQFDGAYRQGVAILAIVAAGGTPDANALTWLVDQQCADGSWTPYRSDTSQPCPTSPGDFTGPQPPDTNSTALAVMALAAAGDTKAAAAGVNALEAVQLSDGSWGYYFDAAAGDPNSTALVAAAIRTATGTVAGSGIGAVQALQVGCDAAAADQGGIALPDDPTFPNLYATLQSVPALAGVAFPIVDASIATGLPDVCPAPAATTTTTSATTTTTTTTTAAVVTTLPAVGGGDLVRGEGLARTGTDGGPLSAAALGLIIGGIVLVVAARRRGARRG